MATFFRVADRTLHIPCPNWCYLLPKVTVKGFILFGCNCPVGELRFFFVQVAILRRVLIYDIFLYIVANDCYLLIYIYHYLTNTSFFIST